MPDLLSSESPAFLVARLALLALRAGIGKDTPLDADRVALDGAPAISVDSAARALAALPKPTMCDAEARDGVLAVRCVALADADPRAREWYDVTRRDEPERGGFLGWVEDEYGLADHTVLVVGRDEMLAFPLSVVERWRTDYEISSVNFGTGGADNPHAEDAEFREVKRVGARAVVHFTSPEDSRTTMQMSTLSLDEPMPAESRADAEKHLIDMARMFRTFLMIDSDVGDPPSAKPESKWSQWKRRSAKHARNSALQLGAEMERFFAGREMPPEVAAFIRACREQG